MLWSDGYKIRYVNSVKVPILFWKKKTWITYLSFEHWFRAFHRMCTTKEKRKAETLKVIKLMIACLLWLNWLCFKYRLFVLWWHVDFYHCVFRNESSMRLHHKVAFVFVCNNFVWNRENCNKSMFDYQNKIFTLSSQ